MIKSVLWRPRVISCPSLYPALAEVIGQKRIRGICPTTNISGTYRHTTSPHKVEMMLGEEEDIDTTHTHPHHLTGR
jgi:hypothetical protein